jgi:drug/metabolite transporter (DMT)-like permease
LSSQKAGVAITAVFSKMSVVIPVIAGIFLYAETLNALKIMGIVSTLAAFILIFYKKEKSKIKLAVIILPIIIFFANGFIDTALKFIEFNHISGDYTLFLTVIFITAFLISLIISILKYVKTRKPFTIQTMIGGAILGLLNYSTTYFMLLAMSLFQSNVLFPIQNVGIVMLSALFGLFLFKEKLSLINWIGIFLSIMAILLIAFA